MRVVSIAVLDLCDSTCWVAIDPSGQRIAVGDYRTTAVSILDAKTLMSISKAQTSGVSESLLAVAWSSDGATLVAGGLASEEFDGQWYRLLRRFDAACSDGPPGGAAQ